MEKEKSVRKKSTEKYCPLPIPPPDPVLNDLPEAFKRIIGYKEREATFFKSLKETIEMENKISKSDKKRKHSSGSGGGGAGAQSTSSCNDSEDGGAAGARKPIDYESDILLSEECENYVMPLVKRTGPSVSAALVTEGAIDQLDKLHGLLEQLLHMQEQNYKLRRSTRDVDTLIGLKKIQKRMSKDPESLINTNIEISDDELEFENNESLLETILAAGKSASNKRIFSKRHRLRSKSILTDDLPIVGNTLHLGNVSEQENKPYPLRRQSAVNDIKAKVSKWTKVKAAFKWERANVPSLNEGKSTDSGIGLSPINNEVARYLRVPSVPCTGSSADSILSSSSGHLLSGGSIPPTPGTMSSASSIEDVGAMSEEFRNNRDSSKSESRCESRTQDDEARRSRSLDGDVTLSFSSRQLDKQNKNKTPWGKVKDIIQTHRGSLKGKSSRSRSVKSTSSVGCSRDASPCDSVDNYSNVDTNADRTESCSSSQTSPIRKNYPTLMLTTPVFVPSNGSSPSSPSGHTASFSIRDELEQQQLPKSFRQPTRGSRKSKLMSDIGCLPEGVSLDLTSIPLNSRHHKPPPSPLNLNSRQESSDIEPLDNAAAATSPIMPHRNLKWTNKMKRSHVISGNGNGNVSAPTSPSKQYEFFGEFESEDLSSGDFSEPCTPHMQISPKSSLAYQQEEINRKYYELQQQISLEFQSKQREWERIRTASVVASSSCSPVPCHQKEDASSREAKSSIFTSKPIEENLTPDFKKKLQEWRIKKQQSTFSSTSSTTSSITTTTIINKDSQSSPTKEGDSKKIDWHLWKTGQIKLEGQGLKQLPDEKDLPEDFQKKLDEWKRMKATGSVHNAGEINVKRLSLKSNQLLKSEGSKKIKSSDEVDKEINRVVERERQRVEREKIKCLEREKSEKLHKLKAMVVVDPPAKEIVVQTSKGVLKFEGISRKFTRKLYEWEKARGIGPEASTFALLHPGYRPILVGNNAENEIDLGEPTSTPMGRSVSMDSISPNPSLPSISHQQSSLSLNNVAKLKENSINSLNDRRVSSNPELELDVTTDEPEACIVEVEDDYIETASSLFTASPMIEQQTPVYRYEQTRKEFCAGNKEAVYQDDVPKNLAATKALKDATKLVSSFKEVRHGFKENILHVQQVLSSLHETLPQLKLNLKSKSSILLDSVDIVKDLAKEIMKMLSNLDESISSKEELDERMTAIDSQLIVLRKTLNFICKNTDSKKMAKNDDLPAISITSDELEKNVATVSYAPAIYHGEVVLNEVQVMDHRYMYESTDEPQPISSTNSNVAMSSSQSIDDLGKKSIEEQSTRTQISEQDVKKITKNLNNGATKRKTKLRRLGSRQNSKTESDSDEDPQNVIVDTPRRVKRKTSRAKKVIDPDEPTAAVCEDVVYVLKLKPGQKIEQAEVNVDANQIEDVEHTVTLPTPTSLTANDPEQDKMGSSANVFVKTKRKIFSPVMDTKFGAAVIVRDLDPSSSSTEKSETPIKNCLNEDNDDKKVTNLPPLPQSPSMQRRLEQKSQNLPKEPSPAIRIMIAKYNQRLSAERRNSSPHSSGSCSPVWRSPILERRVRTQTEKYLCQVKKSLSAGNVQRDETKPIEPSTPDAAQSAKGVLKSLSAGILSENYEQTPEIQPEDCDISCLNSLACDSLQKIYKKKEIIAENAHITETKCEGVFRKNTDSSASARLTSKSGVIKKILIKPSTKEEIDNIPTPDTESEDTIDKTVNTIPIITRKNDGKPPSPRIQHRPLKACLELNIRNPSLSPSSSAILIQRSQNKFEKVNIPISPLSDRALKLKKAKEEFLKPATLRTACYCDGEEIWKNRLSQISAGSESSTDTISNCIITKSASVGMINSSGSDGQQQDGYVSLPRNSTRPSKSQGTVGKFGFSNIASKFRKVKLRKSATKDTLSKLCRQSLMVDISKEKRTETEATNSTNLTESHSTEKLKKSGSGTSGFGSLLFRRQERAEKLKKSKSIGQLEQEPSK